MRRKFLRNIGPTLPGMETYETAERTTSRPLTSSAEASPAKMFLSLANAPVLKGSAQRSGQSLPDSFASLDPNGCWLKTCRGCTQQMMDGSLEAYSETWPRAGMMRNGTAYRLSQLVPLTDVIGCSSWPTPRAEERQQHNSRDDYVALSKAVKMWPTPTGYLRDMDTMERARYSRDQLRRMKHFGHPYQTQTTGQLNPTWVEWLMGFPPGWTDLDASETQ